MPKLFTAVRPTVTYDEDPEKFVEQLQLFHLRFFGKRVEPDSEEVLANIALFQDLYEVDPVTERAWIGVVSALLRDPDMLFY